MKKNLNTNSYHIPALLEETIKGLNINPSGVYVDVTFGGGGHSKKILKNLNNKGKLFVFDKDIEAKNNLIEDERVTFIHSDYRYFNNFLKLYGVTKVDSILADLGVSFYQFDEKERGFSIRYESDLDMRMDKRQKISAFNIINEYSKEDLERIFKYYGEVKNYRKVTESIVLSRKDKDIKTTFDLIEVIKNETPKFKENKYLSKIFQAIRIEVNQELEGIKEFLINSEKTLNIGGRLCVISYHSLEDRLVKNFTKKGMFKGEPEKDFYGNINVPFKVITRKPIIPSDEEIEKNSRSRSAKLRICEKI